MLSDMVSDNILKPMTELSTVKLTAYSGQSDSICIIDSQSDTYIY